MSGPERLRDLPKYVVSSTIEHPSWSNATVLKGDVLEAVSTLKQELAGDIVVYASYQLGRMLIENDLVDELRLFVFPVVVGAGERLFGAAGGQKPLQLIDTRTVGESLIQLTYRPSRDGSADELEICAERADGTLRPWVPIGQSALVSRFCAHLGPTLVRRLAIRSAGPSGRSATVLLASRSSSQSRAAVQNTMGAMPSQCPSAPSATVNRRNSFGHTRWS